MQLLLIEGEYYIQENGVNILVKPLHRVNCDLEGYFIDENANVYSRRYVHKIKRLKTNETLEGYKTISLRIRGKSKVFVLARLLIGAFFSQSTVGKRVRYLDKNIHNLSLNNLVLCTDKPKKSI